MDNQIRAHARYQDLNSSWQNYISDGLVVSYVRLTTTPGPFGTRAIMISADRVDPFYSSGRNNPPPSPGS